MSRSKFGTFQSLFNQCEQFDRISAQTDTLIKLDTGIRTIIGKPLSDHIQISCVRRNFLIYTVDQQIWAHGLRLHKQKILGIIQQLLASKERYAHRFSEQEFKLLGQISDIIVQVKLKPKPRPSHQFERSTKVISERNADMLLRTAEGFEDEELKKIWVRFVNRNRANPREH